MSYTIGTVSIASNTVSGVEYPIIGDTVLQSIATSTGVGTSAYSNGKIIGTAPLTFTSVARGNALGGTINTVSLYCEVPIIGTYKLKLYDKAIATTWTNNTLYSALALTDTEAQSHFADITLGNDIASANNASSSESGLSVSYKCDTSSTSIYGILIATSTFTLTAITGTGIKVKLAVFPA